MFEGKRVIEALQYLAGELTGDAQFLKLSLEERLFVSLTGDLLGLKAIPGGRIDGDAAVRIDDTRAESDGRNVPLARGPQAQDEAERTGQQIRLIRVGNDGGVEEGG